MIVSSPQSSEYEDDSDTLRKKKVKIVDLISSSPQTNTSPNRSKLTQATLPGTPTRAKTANHPPNAAPIRLPSQSWKNGRKSASTSPEKKGARPKAGEAVKSANLMTMFSNQMQRQGPNVPRRADTAAIAAALHEEDDIISDDDDRGMVQQKPASTSVVGIAAKKRALISTTGGEDVVSGSHKFMRKANSVGASIDSDTRPWAERFAPTNLDELAVHKKKVSDVKSWLESVFEGQLRQRMLVLKGAAGTAKTATVQLVAKALDCKVLEWRNPVGSVASSEGFLSMAAQFEDFIGKGGKWGQLELTSEDVALPKPASKPLDRRKSLLLVEEFPNTFTKSSTAMLSFRSALLQYLASNVPSPSMMYAGNVSTEPITPLVLVISETLLTTSTASADSFTAHRLLGPEILQHPGVSVIEFNSIAPTILAKALELIVVKEARKSGRRKTPGPLVLKRLGEVGDIRSAVGSLEFLCLRGDENGDWSAKIAFTKGKKAKDTPMTKMEEESLELVTRREASLGIFHAVGKVVYNKREDSKRMDGVEDLPEWNEERSRPKRSQVHVEELIDETGTDTSTFVAALHENYILSCDANTSDIHDFSDLDHVNGCIDALSDSDLLCPSWDGSINATGFGGGVGGKGSGGDVLRQDEMCFQLAVRGILFSLPCPVKRKAPAGEMSRGGSQFRMFYPTSLKLWRPKEEIESMIDLWTTRLMSGSITIFSVGAGATTYAKLNADSVESWKSRSAFSSQVANTSILKDTTSAVIVSSSARKEMLLERLPYMTLIARARKGGTSPEIRQMEKVTVFNGIGNASAEDDDGLGEDVQVGEAWATDRQVDAEDGIRKRRIPRSNTALGMQKETGVGGLEKRFAEQKLVLSDDDIEDD